VPEVLVTLDSLYVFGCKDGQYVTLDKERGFAAPGYLRPIDMNRDGVRELVVYRVDPSGSAEDAYVNILEWDGQGFANLLAQPAFQSPRAQGGVLGTSIWMTHLTTFSQRETMLVDVDGDGLVELRVTGGVPVPFSGADADGATRPETHTYRWNGAGFVLASMTLGPARFRFQAVQDGDAAALNGDYAGALAAYQAAIFSDQLEWYTPERWWNEHEVALWSNGSGLPRPTPASPDPAEYGHLAAYARFRIMLLHLVHGTEADAATVYMSLRARVPPGEPGFVFVEMAEHFWAEYQSTHALGPACKQAQRFIASYPEALGYLSQGAQAGFFEPQDTCPYS
jgi:hypothetical protein